MYYAGTSTTATRVYGQEGSFTSGTVNNGGITATSLDVPTDIVTDHNSNVYIADEVNNRVLYYAGTSTTATRVYGQGGSFTSGTVNNGGITATSLSAPYGTQIDGNNDLYIVDTSNNRVLFYPVGNTTPTRVYGQGGSFTTATTGTTATSLNTPVGMEFDTNGNLYIADDANNRVLEFQTNLVVTTQPPAIIPVGSTFTTTISLEDVGSGSIYTDFTGSITLALKSGSGTAGAVLSGTLSINAVNGAATFSNLAINTAGSGYILTASSIGVGSGDTNSFIIAGPLLFTYLTSSTFSFRLTGATGTVTSQHTFKVNDTTFSGAGWHITITSTQFTTSGSATLPTTATQITAVSAACTPAQTCNPTHQWLQLPTYHPCRHHSANGNILF